MRNWHLMTDISLHFEKKDTKYDYRYKYRNGLLPMQYVFFDTLERWLYEIRHEAQPSDVFLTTNARAYQKHVLRGQETVSIFISNLHAIFNNILRKNHGTLLYCGRIVRHYDSERVWGRVLKFSQTDEIDSV